VPPDSGQATLAGRSRQRGWANISARVVTYGTGRLPSERPGGGVHDAASGKELRSPTPERFRGENITWGLSECLIMDERAVYATPAGRVPCWWRSQAERKCL
jgi:hypothetical protein